MMQTFDVALLLTPSLRRLLSGYNLMIMEENCIGGPFAYSSKKVNVENTHKGDPVTEKGQNIKKSAEGTLL